MKTNLLFGLLLVSVVAKLPAQAVFTLNAYWQVTQAFAVNDSGIWVGADYQTNNYSVNIEVQGGGALLGLGGGNDNYATGINNSNRVVGVGLAPGGVWHGAYYDMGAGTPGPFDLGTFGGTTSHAAGVNNSGQIVGYAQTTGNAGNRAFLWTTGTMTNLGTLGGTNSYGYAVNNSGTVVGSSQITGDGATHAFTWNNGSFTDLGTLGGTVSTAFNINSSGQVVGRSYVAGDTAYHAFLYSGGSMIDLGTLPGYTNSYARAISDSGMVLGEAFNATGPSRAFLYYSGMMVDLNSLNISGVPSGWYFYDARDINSSGQIVGRIDEANGTPHGFILTPTGVPLPVPEPATYAALAGLGALGLALWRRGKGRSVQIS